MTDKLIGTLGLLTTILFIVGFIGLFIINPQTYDELNNLSISSYNLEGMNGAIWIESTGYIGAGLLNIFIFVGLIRKTKPSMTLVGEIFMLTTGVLWTTFGVINYDVNTDLGIHLLLVRTMVVLATSMLGLLLFGGELERIIEDKFLKCYTVLSGAIVLLLSVLSVFVFNDETWIRTNISLTIYFVWFGVFGLRFLQREKQSPTKSISHGGAVDY